MNGSDPQPHPSGAPTLFFARQQTYICTPTHKLTHSYMHANHAGWNHDIDDVAASKACLLCYLVKVKDHSACFPIILYIYEN